jgi:hypothetical protein
MQDGLRLVDLIPEAITSAILAVVAEVLEGAGISKSIGYGRHCTSAVARIVTQ